MATHSRPTAPATGSEAKGSRSHAWYLPTISQEHGVYVMLLVSFLTGAAAAQHWTTATTLALVCSLAGFQAEHPWTLQIKQRRTWQPRFWFWGGVYSLVSLGLAIYLYLHTQVPMLWVIYGAAGLAFGIDAFSVYRRQQKSPANEGLTFAAVCLCAPLAYVVTTGSWDPQIWGLWLLNTLFFGSAIFTVKLRKPKTSSLQPGILYHGLASLVVVILTVVGEFPTVTASAFGVVLFKFGWILLRREWYRTTWIQQVATLETASALAFLTFEGFGER